MTRCVGAAFILCKIFLFPPAVNIREYRTRNIVPHGEYGAGYSRHDKARERGRRKARGKARILHADFDGKCLRLGCREFQQLPEAEPAAVTEQVMEYHHREHDKTGRKDLCGVVRDDRRHNHRDGNHRDERQDLHGTCSPFAEELVDDKPERNRHDDNLHDGKEHRQHIHVHGGAQKQVRNRRSQHGSEQRIHAGHAYGERHVALREVGNNVTRCAAGTRAYENHACHEGCIEPENLGEQERKCRHYNELRRTPDGNFLRARKHELKIAQLEREPHAEHHDHQKVIHPAELNPECGFGQEQRERRNSQDDNRHPLANKITDFFKNLHF